MRSSVDLLLAVALIVPGPRTPLRDAIASSIALAWAVPADAVALDWSRAPDVDTSAAVFHRLQPPDRDGRVLLAFGLGDSARTVMVRAGVRVPVTCAARALPAGAVIDVADVRLESRVHWGAPAPAAVAPGAGWRTRRAIAEGEALAAPAVAPPTLVRAGEPVTLVWASGTVHISMSGVALHAASAGDVVRVRVDGRPGRHTAVVTAAGRATLFGDRP